MARFPRLSDRRMYDFDDDDDGDGLTVDLGPSRGGIPPRRRYGRGPSIAEYGYEAPRSSPSNDEYAPSESLPKRLFAKVDGALSGKNIGWTLLALIVIFGLVILLWNVVNKRR